MPDTWSRVPNNKNKKEVAGFHREIGSICCDGEYVADLIAVSKLLEKEPWGRYKCRGCKHEMELT